MFHGGLNKKLFFVVLAYLHGAPRGEEAGQEYLVTMVNAYFWFERDTNTMRHSWTTVYACLLMANGGLAEHVRYQLHPLDKQGHRVPRHGSVQQDYGAANSH